MATCSGGRRPSAPDGLRELHAGDLSLTCLHPARLLLTDTPTCPELTPVAFARGEPMRSSSPSVCRFRAHGRRSRHARSRNVLSLSHRRLGLRASPSGKIEKLARSFIGQDVRPFAQRSVRRRLPSERRLAAREDTLWLENRPRAPSFDRRSCVPLLSRSARHLAATRLLDTKR